MHSNLVRWQLLEEVFKDQVSGAIGEGEEEDQGGDTDDDADTGEENPLFITFQVLSAEAKEVIQIQWSYPVSLGQLAHSNFNFFQGDDAFCQLGDVFAMGRDDQCGIFSFGQIKDHIQDSFL